MNRNATGMSIDDFLGHKTGGGGSSVFLKNDWKDDGQIVIWLHTQSLIYPLWAHNWPKVVEREDRKTKEKKTEVWSDRFVCHEREAILRKMRFRDRDTGEREYPPEVCPCCILPEVVRRLVNEGAISWVDPIFRFEADDEDRSITITAGGCYNGFNRKDLSKSEIAELRRAGIRRDEAWRENLLVRCSYLFQVVQASEPGEGLKLALTPSALGDKMKGAIRDEIRRRGKEKGNPMLTPYPFEWQFDEKAQFDDKYHVVALDEEPSDEVRDLIEGEPLETDEIIEKGNCAALRASMEAHALVELPWDEIFGPAEKAGLMKAQASEPKKARTPEVRSAKAGAATSADEAEDETEEDETEEDETEEDETRAPGKGDAAEPELYECDHCGKETLSETDFVCSECGAEYVEEGKQVVLAKRPCALPGCATKVDVTGEGPNYICESCSTIHKVVPNNLGDIDSWEVVKAGKLRTPKRTRTTAAVEPEPAPAVAPKRTRSGVKSAVKPEPKGKGRASATEGD